MTGEEHRVPDEVIDGATREDGQLLKEMDEAIGRFLYGDLTTRCPAQKHRHFKGYTTSSKRFYQAFCPPPKDLGFSLQFSKNKNKRAPNTKSIK